MTHSVLVLVLLWSPLCAMGFGMVPPFLSARRILYLLTSLESDDWDGILPAKWAQLHEGLSGVGNHTSPLRMMGFSRKDAAVNGTWATSNDGTKFHQVSNVSAVDLLAWKAFVAEHYVAGGTHLVIGTHGEGDFLWFNGVTSDGGKTVHGGPGPDDGVSFPIERFVKETLAPYQFLSVVLDTCINGELYTAMHFAEVTPYVVAAEGWMWSADKALDKSIFSLEGAKAMADPTVTTFEALHTVVRHYTRATDLADASILHTRSAKAFVDYLTTISPYKTWMVEALEGTKKRPREFSRFCFYTVRDEDDTWDSMYLLDVGRMMAEAQASPAVKQMWDDTVLLHQGPQNYTKGDYNFSLTGLSVTVIHL